MVCRLGILGRFYTVNLSLIINFPGGSFAEIFRNSSNLQLLSDLMNELPELTETLIYMNTQQDFMGLQNVRTEYK